MYVLGKHLFVTTNIYKNLQTILLAQNIYVKQKMIFLMNTLIQINAVSSLHIITILQLNG